MKIICVAPYFYPSVGGVQNYVLNISCGLQRDYRHQLVIVTAGSHAGGAKKDVFEGMTRYSLPSQFKLFNTPISFNWQKQISSIIAEEHPDLLLVHTPVPFMADMAIRAAGNLPSLLTYHNDLAKDSLFGTVLSKTFYILLSNKTLKQATAIVATSQYYADHSPYLRAYKQKTRIVTPGVDTARFHPGLDKQWLHSLYGLKKIVLFVGILEKTHTHKGVDVLIKAVAQAKVSDPTIQLIIAGKGDAIPDYRQLAQRLGIAADVHFPGFVSDEDLPKYYAGADVFVLPSTNQAEGFGMVLAEAQACGTPVIGSRIGGIPFVITDQETGRLVAPGDVTQLAAAITTVLTADSRALTKRASKRIEQQFSWQALVKKTNDIVVSMVP